MNSTTTKTDNVKEKICYIKYSVHNFRKYQCLYIETN